MGNEPFTVCGMSENGVPLYTTVRTLDDARKVLTAQREDMMKANNEAQELREKLRQKQHIELRDYFAAAALTGLLSRSGLSVPHCKTCCENADDPGEHYADISYRYADAMLAAREVRNDA